MDFEAAAKLSGAGFVVLKNGLAKMERALGQFMLDVHTTDHGYTEIAPPLLVRDEVMYGTAQLPKFAIDQFAAVRELTAQERYKLRDDVLNALLTPEERTFLDAPFTGDGDEITMTPDEVVVM